MNATAQQLLDAHVAYTLNQLTGNKLSVTIASETSLIYHWVIQQNLGELLPKDRVKAAAERLVQEASVSDATKAYFESLGQAVLDYVAKEDIEIDDLISKNTWDRIVEKVVEQREFRNEFIHRLTTNKFYGEMLSEILYNSIKSFMQETNPLGGNSSKSGGLFSVGKGLLGAALSGMEDTIDKNVKKFLSDNINKTLRDSEKIIQSRLTDENIRRGAGKLWDKLDDINFKELAAKAKKYTSSGKDTTSDLIAAVALEVRNAKAFKQISDVIFDHFYNTYGNQPLKVIFDNLHITEEKVIRESVAAAEDIVGRLHSTGFLEARVREHLSGFYSSTEVENILG